MARIKIHLVFDASLDAVIDQPGESEYEERVRLIAEWEAASRKAINEDAFARILGIWNGPGLYSLPHQADLRVLKTWGPVDTVENIKATIRQAVLATHPDRFGDAEVCKKVLAIRDRLGY